MRLTEQQLQRLISRLVQEAQTEEKQGLRERLEAALQPGVKIEVSDSRSGFPEKFMEAEVLKSGRRVRTSMISEADPFRFEEGADDNPGILTDIIDRISPIVLVPFMCVSETKDTTSPTEVEFPGDNELSIEDLQEKGSKKTAPKSKTPSKIKPPKYEEETSEPEASSYEMLGSSTAGALNKIAQNPVIQRMIKNSPTSEVVGQDYEQFNIERIPNDFSSIEFRFDFDSDETLSQAALKPAAGTILAVEFSRKSDDDDIYRSFEKVFKSSGVYDGTSAIGNITHVGNIEKTVKKCMPLISVSFYVLEDLQVVVDHLEKLCKLDFYQVKIDGTIIQP